MPARARALAAAVALAAGAAAQSLADPRPDLADALDRAVRERAGPGFAGAVLVARDGRIALRRGYGSAQPGGPPATPATLFDVASVSKAFTATAILALETQGALGVHDPLSEHFDGLPPDKASIRIHHLLTHTSGLAPDIDFTDPELGDRDAMLARVWREPLLFPPGERFAYNNTGYSVLAALVELATRGEFERWIERHLFGPAGMRDSGFIADPDLRVERAAARFEHPADAPNGDTAVEWPWHWAFRGATGIVTTVDDLYRWDRALYGDRVLPRAARHKMFRPMAGDYAYGWVVTRTERGTPRLGHDGSTYGFRAVLVRFPDEDAALILAGNRQANLRELALDLERILFAAPPPPERLSTCAGRYRLPGGDELEVALDGERLLLRPQGSEAAARFLYGTPAPDHDPYSRHGLGERALRLLRPLIRGRTARLDDSFAATAPASALEHCRTHWQRCVREHGAYRSAHVIGSRKAEQATYLRIVFGRTPVTWRAVWERRQRFVSLEPAERQHPFEAELQWRKGHEFALRSADGFTDLGVRFEVRGGRATGLLWSDRGNPEGAELRCRRL